MRRLLFAMIAALLGLSLSAPPQAAAQAAERCFEETGHCIGGRIREFWEQSGGLEVFGLPITALRAEQIEGRSIEVQWFERNRLELHPENARPYDVLLGRLGADRLAQQGRDWFSFPKAEPQPDCRLFPETGHSVCGPILAAWRARGLEIDGRPGASEAESLALFGLPLSGPTVELLEGKEYTVQWFERARFELHPENAPPFDVLLGRLGSEIRGRPDPRPLRPGEKPEIATSLGTLVLDQVTQGDRYPEGCNPDIPYSCFYTPAAGYRFIFTWFVTRDGSEHQLEAFRAAAADVAVTAPDGARWEIDIYGTQKRGGERQRLLLIFSIPNGAGGLSLDWPGNPPIPLGI